MAFLPVNNTSGNMTLGTAGKTMTWQGGMVLGTPAQTYTTAGQTIVSNTWYEVTPRNWLATYVPYLVIGKINLTASPWFIRYAVTFMNLQQNGDSRGNIGTIALTQQDGMAVYVGNCTTYYADGVAPFKIYIYPDAYSFSIYGTFTHEFYRLGV